MRIAALGLASIDFLKQEKVLEDLERSSYDVVVTPGIDTDTRTARLTTK